MLASLTIGLMQGWATITIVASAFLGALMALASAALAMLVMPLAESATRITTDLTLLELSDLGRPLLRRLALEAPGTWAHSLAMANLCESACNIIGANGLLARVGCYYHDIGKLAPRASSSRTRAGDRIRTTSSRRPNPRASSASTCSTASPWPKRRGCRRSCRRLFRSTMGPRRSPISSCAPGAASRTACRTRRLPLSRPAPQRAETAVAMLADSAEAAIRVLPDPTPDKVREAIELLVQQKLASGQLDDAPLTLRDIDRVKREFARVMSGTYHKRIGYPRASGGITSEFQTAERQ